MYTKSCIFQFGLIFWPVGVLARFWQYNVYFTANNACHRPLNAFKMMPDAHCFAWAALGQKKL